MRTTQDSFGSRALGFLTTNILRATVTAIAAVPVLHTIGAVGGMVASSSHGADDAHGKSDSHSTVAVAVDQRDPEHSPEHTYPALRGNDHDSHGPHHPDEEKHIETIGVRGRSREQEGQTSSDQATSVMQMLRIGHLTGDEEAWGTRPNHSIHGAPPVIDDATTRHEPPDSTVSSRASQSMPWLLQAAHRNGVRSVVVGSVDTDELTIVVPHTSHKAVDAMVRDLGGTVTERHRREAGRTQGLTLSTPFGNAHVYYALNGKSYRDLSSDHASRSVRFANTNGTVSQRVTIDAGNATAGAFAAVSPSLRPDSVRPASLDGLRLRSHGDLGTHW